jgi:hypothetical protein
MAVGLHIVLFSMKPVQSLVYLGNFLVLAFVNRLHGSHRYKTAVAKDEGVGFDLLNRPLVS